MSMHPAIRCNATCAQLSPQNRLDLVYDLCKRKLDPLTHNKRLKKNTVENAFDPGIGHMWTTK